MKNNSLVLSIAEKEDKIEEIIESMNDDEVVDAWNSFCPCGYEVHEMDDIDSDLYGYTVREALEQFDLDGLDFSDGWYRVNGGSYESTDDIWDFIDISDLVEHAIDEDDDLGNDEIRDILDATDPDDIEELTPEEEAEEVAYWSTEGEPEQVAEPVQEERKTYNVTLSDDDLGIMLKALDVLYIRLANAKHDIKEECVCDWASKCARALDLLHDVEKEETR